ncbi:unnamed protein product [Oncorhynchus mykiss]|uniref:Secreted protein n=1 Tax=Oncorhynchus mykiss TaxID=8022 RepID=A0A060XUF9_ONCMY|nr:unnamed protein product [Oncorhynchus mykiss]
MTPLYSIAVVWLFTYALCEDFCKNTNFFGGAHTTFVNTPRPRDSPVLSGHNLNKRSTDPDGETCKSLTGFESTLKNNTHTNVGGWSWEDRQRNGTHLGSGVSWG